MGQGGMTCRLFFLGYHVSPTGQTSQMNNTTLKKNLESIHTRIARACETAKRNPRDITIMAVTKTVAPTWIATAYENGIRHFGENRLQEAERKISDLRAQLPGATWSMIGHLQSNKVKKAVSVFDEVHSVDSDSLALALNKHAGELGRVVPVLIEINSSGEAQKNGVSPMMAPELIEYICGLPNIRLSGVMTIGPLSENVADIRRAFVLTRKVFEKLSDQNRRCLSMGMSGDFEIAIEEGATLIRLGTALFGARG